MKNISRQMRSSPQASGVKLPKNASKPPPSRLCSHLDSQFSHNAPPSHCDETKGWIAKNGTSVNGRYIHPTHRGGFYHGPPRDPSKSFQVLGPLGWQTQTSSPNMATTLQPPWALQKLWASQRDQKKNGHAPNCNFLSVKVAVPLEKRPSRLEW